MRTTQSQSPVAPNAGVLVAAGTEDKYLAIAGPQMPDDQRATSHAR